MDIVVKLLKQIAETATATAAAAEKVGRADEMKDKVLFAMLLISLKLTFTELQKHVTEFIEKDMRRSKNKNADNLN